MTSPGKPASNMEARVLFFVILLLVTATTASTTAFSKKKQHTDPQHDDTNDDDDVPATVQTSPFPHHLYPHTQEPYISYRCLPRNVHLSPGDDDPSNGAESAMTVSFALPRSVQECQPENIRACVNLQEKGPTTSTSSERSRVCATELPKSYDFTSSNEPADVPTYKSDWIYHIKLSGLKLGRVEYTYRIEVEKIRTSAVHDGLSEEEVSTTTALGRRRHLTEGVVRTSGSDNSLRGRSMKGVSSSAIIATSPTRSFRTPPLHNSPTQIALVGDLGQTYNSTLTMLHMLRSSLSPNAPPPTATTTSLVLCAGDMSYANSNQTLWPNWFTLIEPLISRVPLVVAPGNHEIECDIQTGTIFTAYENWFRMPNRLQPAIIDPIDTNDRYNCSTPSAFLGTYDFGNAFFALTHGFVRIIVLNSYTDTSVHSVQYRFLKSELEDKLDRNVTPWVIVMFHCPWYNTFNSHINEFQAVQMQQSMEPLLVKHRVNLVVTGHDHAYLRTHPVQYNQVDRTSPVHVTVGAGGNKEGHVPGYQHIDPEIWVAKRDRFEYGFGLLNVRDERYAKWTWVRDGLTRKGMQDDVWLENQYFL